MVNKAYSNGGLLTALTLWFVTMLAAPWILASPDSASGSLTAVFRPGASNTDMMLAVAQAGGLVLRAGRFDNILVVYDDTPGFSGRLKGAGAWTILDTRLAAGCLLVPDTVRQETRRLQLPPPPAQVSFETGVRMPTG